MSRLVASFVLLLGAAFAASPRAAEKPEGLAWCYRSLADVVCYIGPDAGREDRFVGSYPFRPDAARRLLIDESRRRAAALAPRRWPPVSPSDARAAAPAPATERGAPERPAQPVAKKTGAKQKPTRARRVARPPPIPVPRPSDTAAALRHTAAVEATGAGAPAPSFGRCTTGDASRPRPLLGAGSACDAESD